MQDISLNAKVKNHIFKCRYDLIILHIYIILSKKFKEKFNFSRHKILIHF